MDGGAWWTLVHGVAEWETTEVTKHRSQNGQVIITNASKCFKCVKHCSKRFLCVCLIQ